VHLLFFIARVAAAVASVLVGVLLFHNFLLTTERAFLLIIRRR
jgi:hypothetical protein